MVRPEQQISAAGAQQESLGPGLFAAQTDGGVVGVLFFFVFLTHRCAKIEFPLS